MEPGLLQDRVAVVTGAGRGIGRAIAYALSAAGAVVVAASRSGDEIAETVSTIRKAGGSALAVPTDVANKRSVDDLVTQTLATFSKIDVLVNNAGIQGAIGPMVDNDPQEWALTVQVNLLGTFYCSQAVLPTMISRRQGKIINMSGGGATSPRPNFSAYAASKAAIVRLTENLAEEVRDQNIQVNAIAPGAVNTRMLDEVLAANKQAGAEYEAAQKRANSGGTPPEVAAGLVVFLASDASKGLTGKLIAASHDDWQNWDEARIIELMAKPWLTLRRLDPYTLNPLVSDLTA